MNVNKVLNILVLIVSSTLIGCSSFQKIDHEASYEVSYITKMTEASEVRGYKPAVLNLIKYKGEKAVYKFQLKAMHKKRTPSFKAGESLTFILNDFDKIKLSSIDGEVNICFKSDKAVRGAYYEVDVDTLQRIAKAKKARFLVEGKAYNVAGELSRSELKLFKELIAEGEDD